VRGKLSDELETILLGYGFALDEEAAFMMTLKSSTSHRRKRTSTYVKRSEPLSPLPSLALITAPKETLSIVLGLSRVLEINPATKPRDLALYHRAQVADYYFGKAVLLSLTEEVSGPHHPHSFFLPNGALPASDPALFGLLSVFEIELVEMDFEADLDQLPVELVPGLSPFMARTGRVVFLKSAAALSRTLNLQDQLVAQFSVDVFPIAEASPYYSGLLHSEPTLKE
jgi:hypothetical protein